MPNIFKSNTNRIKTPNRNNNISNKIASYLSNNLYKLNLPLPSMINNCSTINKNHNYTAYLYYNTLNKKINLFSSKVPTQLIQNKDNNNMNNNNKDNIESVEWMLYNKKKNSNDINVLDELYTLKKMKNYFK